MEKIPHVMGKVKFGFPWKIIIDRIQCNTCFPQLMFWFSSDDWHLISLSWHMDHIIHTWRLILESPHICRTYLIHEGLAPCMRDSCHAWWSHLDKGRKARLNTSLFQRPHAWVTVYRCICKGPIRGNMGLKGCNTSPITPSWFLIS